MNTKVEEALGVLEGGRYVIPANGLPRGIVFVGQQADALEQARTTLAAHIAQQDATIARLTEAAKVAIATLPYMGGNTMSAHTLESKLRTALKDSP